MPVLLRHYLKLGGRLLAFSVDSEFSNALDGLIVVDLTQTDRKLLERYLGRIEAEIFLDFHKSQLVKRNSARGFIMPGRKHTYGHESIN